MAGGSWGRGPQKSHKQIPHPAKNEGIGMTGAAPIPGKRRFSVPRSKIEIRKGARETLSPCGPRKVNLLQFLGVGQFEF
jgi:hypothetical protein